MSSRDKNQVDLLEIILDSLPNACCEDPRTCPYDCYDAYHLAEALECFVAQVWADGQTAGYQGAHAALNAFGYIERGKALPNPWPLCEAHVEQGANA